MMYNLMDWILSKMKLVEIEDEPEEPEIFEEPIEKSWLELINWKKGKEPEKASCVFFKNVQGYADCKLLIDKYKMGAICIYRIDMAINSDAQGMMKYICGGIYALDGEVGIVGENVFMIIMANSVESGE